ncbi:hypothetical protein LTR17_016775 [Elasticomyces elasticus]|nr:hypothetical protein LTR17_016775 [Elasticomyces elasticus]
MWSQTTLLAACAVGALAQSTTTLAQVSSASTAMATVLIGTVTSGLEASVVDADACGGTTYAFTCTDSRECSAAPTFSLTEGPTHHQFSYATSTAGATGSYAESCSLSGSSYAVCVVTLSLSAPGTSTHTKTTVTASGTDLHYGQFPITAGAEKLATATGSCTSSGNAAAPTGVQEVYKVLVAPAAAAVVLAGALF